MQASQIQRRFVSEEQMKELEELDKRKILNYNNHINLRNMIMEDNESTINLFFNRSYLRNGQTWKANCNTSIETNGRVLVVDEMWCVEGFGEAWFHEKAITNILSYADSCDRHHVCCDNWIQDTFYVETDNGTKIFRRHNKLCLCEPGNKALCMNMNTVEEKKKLQQSSSERRRKSKRIYMQHCIPKWEGIQRDSE